MYFVACFWFKKEKSANVRFGLSELRMLKLLLSTKAQSEKRKVKSAK